MEEKEKTILLFGSSSKGDLVIVQRLEENNSYLNEKILILDESQQNQLRNYLNQKIKSNE